MSKPEQVPSIGRAVHYVATNGVHVPADICRVFEDGTVTLFVKDGAQRAAYFSYGVSLDPAGAPRHVSLARVCACERGRLTGIVAQAALALSLGAAGWEPGHATRYDERGMHRAAANHGLPVADCMVAWDGAPLGTFVWARSRGTGALLNCQVSDMSAPQDRRRHMQANLIEADYASSQRICVDWNGPWRDCRVDILRGVSP